MVLFYLHCCFVGAIMQLVLLCVRAYVFQEEHGGISPIIPKIIKNGVYKHHQ